MNEIRKDTTTVKMTRTRQRKARTMRISTSSSSSSSSSARSRILFFFATAILVAFQIFASNTILLADAQDATNDTTIMEVGTDDEEEEDPTWKSLLKLCKHQTQVYTVVKYT